MMVLLSGVLFSTNGQAQEAAGMARVRAANYAIDVSAVVVMVGDQALTETALAFTAATAHTDVRAGTNTLTFDLVDGDIITTEATFQAGYDYTAALIGQMADDSLQVVLIPESELVGGVRDAENPASYAVLLHGISDAPPVDFILDGAVQYQGLAFGDYAVFSISQAPHDILVTFSDDPTQVLFENSGETPPANDLLLLTVMAGDYPDSLDVTGAVSRLPDRTVIDFLRTYQDEQGNTFETLIEALRVTGLDETLVQAAPFTLFAPTDAAFAALPTQTRDLLFAYPDALRAVLSGHIVDEVFTLRAFSGELMVTARDGSGVTLLGDGDTLLINDQAAVLFGGFPVVTNGNVIGVDRVLIP
jgi:uncharacterized surface protein with fasciclin (FAS1) repeats